MSGEKDQTEIVFNCERNGLRSFAHNELDNGQNLRVRYNIQRATRWDETAELLSGIDPEFIIACKCTGNYSVSSVRHGNFLYRTTELESCFHFWTAPNPIEETDTKTVISPRK